jgi:Zn-dependent peptidase ImmA (M78 family)/transcriptional regulator with XRE-family HTH domain
MPAGVKNFVSGRLTMAREARTLRQKELAERIGRTPATVSKWESEDYSQAPEPATLGKLAETLSVDPDWFFKPLGASRSPVFEDVVSGKSHSTAAVFYRSLKSELGVLRAKARARLGFVEAIEEVVSEYVDLPAVDVPDLLDGRNVLRMRMDEIEGCADALRDYWALPEGPVDDLLLLVENAGIVVAEDEIGSLKLDGVSRWSEETGRPYMLLAKDKRVGARRRLDAAHELAHIVLHRGISQDDLEEHFDLIEDQAMVFAGALLMPSREFGNDVYSLSLDALLQIKAKWKVSVGAMIKRLSSLDTISSEHERRLWQYYSYRRWRGNEPLDDVLPVEGAQNLRTSIETIVEGDAATLGELRKEIGLSAADICGLADLPGDYFEPHAPNVVRLQPQRRQLEVSAEETTETGTVITYLGKKAPERR